MPVLNVLQCYDSQLTGLCVCEPLLHVSVGPLKGHKVARGGSCLFPHSIQEGYLREYCGERVTKPEIFWRTLGSQLRYEHCSPANLYYI